MSLERICGIYKITNIKNNKSYIGSSVNCLHRIYSHKSHLRSGVHYNKHLQRSYDKYGEKNFIFEIIEKCEEDNRHINEYNNIIKYNTLDFRKGYNQDAPMKGAKMSSEATLRMCKYKLKNFTKFELEKDSNKIEFDNLKEAAQYLINAGYANGKERNIRMSLSIALRGIPVWSGVKWCTRLTIYKHNFKILS